MLSCQKSQFSLPEDITYLNCAYMGPLPKEVEQSGIRALSAKAYPHEIFPSDFFNGAEKLRAIFGKLVNIKETGRIALVPSVSYGFANVIKNVRPHKGQNIILVEEIFPSNYYSWKRLADDSGAVIKLVKAPSNKKGRGQLWNEALLDAIDSSTFAVSLPQVHWADGTRYDLAAVRARTTELGALMVIDGSQSIGVMPFDAEALQPDALITVGYKWMFGAYGFGLAYYNERFDYGTPVEENWINRLDSENFQGLVNYQEEYKPLSHRYNVGEYSQFIAVAMLTKSIEMIQGWQLNEIQNYCRSISNSFIERLENQGCQIDDEAYRGGHLFGVRLPAHIDMEALKQKAAEEKVFVSFRGNAVRISPHVYNTPDDFEKLYGVFESVLRS